MKGYALLLLLVIYLVCIEDGDAWRRRRRRRWRIRIRWRRTVEKIRKVVRIATAIKTGIALVGKRDAEADDAVPLPDKKCQISFYDTNGDGNISKEELEPFIGDIQKDSDAFAEFDENGDGSVDEEEFAKKVGLLIAACQS